MTDRAPQDPAVESDGRIGVQTVFEQPLDPTGTNGSAGVMFYVLLAAAAVPGGRTGSIRPASPELCSL